MTLCVIDGRQCNCQPSIQAYCERAINTMSENSRLNAKISELERPISLRCSNATGAAASLMTLAEANQEISRLNAHIAILQGQLEGKQLVINQLEKDARRLDWLELQSVEVRTLAVYGTRMCFMAVADNNFDEDVRPSKLRAQIDLQLNVPGNK